MRLFFLKQINIGTFAREGSGSPLIVTESVTSATTTHVTKVTPCDNVRKVRVSSLKVEMSVECKIFCFLFCRQSKEATQRPGLKKESSSLEMMM